VTDIWILVVNGLLEEAKWAGYILLCHLSVKVANHVVLYHHFFDEGDIFSVQFFTSSSLAKLLYIVIYNHFFRGRNKQRKVWILTGADALIADDFFSDYISN